MKAFEAHYERINTLEPEREKIEEALKYLSVSEKIAILESLGKKYRRLNSVRINTQQMHG